MTSLKDDTADSGRAVITNARPMPRRDKSATDRKTHDPNFNPFDQRATKAAAANDPIIAAEKRRGYWGKKRYAVECLNDLTEPWARLLREDAERENALRDPIHTLPMLAFPGSAAVQRGATDEQLAALTALTNKQIQALKIEATQIRANLREQINIAARRGAMPPARLVLTKVSEVERKHIDWLWSTENLDPIAVDVCAAMIPLHGLTLIAGREGSGKSTLCWWLSAQITQGLLPGYYEDHPRDVVILASEDSESKIRARLEAAGADLDRVHLPRKVTEDGVVLPLSIRDDFHPLIETLSTIQPALVIFDPLKDFLGPGVNSDREDEVRPILTPLLTLTQECGAAVVGLHHLNKSAKGDFLTRLTGSGAFKNVARSVIGVAHDPNTGARVVQLMKSNDAELMRSAFQARVTGVDITIENRTEKVGKWVMDGVSLIDIDTVLAAKEQGSRGGSQTERAKDALAKYLGEEEKPSDEVKKAVAAQLNTSEKTVWRAFTEIGGESRRTAEKPSRTMWSLPSEDVGGAD